MSKNDADYLRDLTREEDAAAKRRYEHHRERRRKATVAGLHLPDTAELLSGFPFLNTRLAADAQAYAERLLPRLRGGPKALVAALQQVTVTPGLAQLQNAAWEIRLVVSRKQHRKLRLEQHVLRFDTYAAAAGCPEAPLRVALGVAGLTHQWGLPAQERAALLSATLGWILVATEPPDRDGPGCPPVRDRAGEAGELAVRRLVQAYGQPEEARAPEATLDSIPNGRRPRRVIPVQQTPYAFPQPASAASETGVVVLHEIGAPNTEDGRRIAANWADLVGARLPVTAVPTDVDRIFTDLATRFPHAAPVVAALRSDLVGRRVLVFRPSILVGQPGSGKTAFLKALLSALNVPHEIFPCAASYHHGITGTDRHWTSAAPSLPMRLIGQHRTATVAIALDEIEKVASGSRRGGRGETFDALLPLLEPSTAASYVEKFFQAACDLSHVIWFATANDLDGMPAPLRDRCRIVQFPEPRPEHLPVLAKNLLRDAVAARGLDPAWALPLDGMELRALEAAWPGGSLRSLGRLVEATLDARDFCPPNERN